MTIDTNEPTSADAAPLSPSIDEQALVEIVAFAWPLMFGAETAQVPFTPIEGGISASISIVGAATATLVVTMDEAMAHQSSAALLMMDESELDDEIIRDAVGETANVVGGNVKGVLEDGNDATLSLPVVSMGGQNVVGGHVTVATAFEVHGNRMTWQLHERT